MQFRREINRLLVGFMIAFLLVAISASYWAVVGADTILLREDNPRRVDAEAAIIRGEIYDRDGELLVANGQNPDCDQTRCYLYEAMNSALGYFSLRYGTGSAEAAFDSTLRGDDIDRDVVQQLSDSLLHRPQVGSHIQLTFDLEIQQALFEAMNGQTGAAVVISVPEGEVLALVSLPAYDPNEDLEQYQDAPGDPLFNRALQGGYQPGGTLQTALMAVSLLAGEPLTETFDNATEPLMLDDVTLTCAVRLPPQSLTLREAYAFACPGAFAELVVALNTLDVVEALRNFLVWESIQLVGFVPEAADSGSSNTPVGVVSNPDRLQAESLGQGMTTVTPLTMALMTAAIINDGNAPTPYALLATRLPDSVDWQSVEEIHPSMAITTTNTARQLQDLMRDAVANGAAQNAGRPNLDVGGHASLAYSGDSTQAWFIGFATLSSRRGATVAVVLEDTADAGLVADIGGSVLATVREQIDDETEVPQS